jgi:hypothetical protein
MLNLLLSSPFSDRDVVAFAAMLMIALSLSLEKTMFSSPKSSA